MKTTTFGRTRALLLAALTAVTVAACGGGDGSPSPFTSPEHDYAIEFPGGEPEREEQQAALPDGRRVPLTLYLSDDGSRTYGTGRIDMETTPGDVGAALEAGRDSAVRTVNGELIDSEMIELQGRPGLAFSATVTSNGVEGTYLARTYLDGAVLYQVVVVGPGELDTTDDDVDRFFDSFTFQDA